MDQLRQIGEVLGSLKALMIFKDEIKINKNQCCLLVDSFSLAFESITNEIKQKLKFEERNSKWKSLEQPLKELNRIFREGEQYIKSFLDVKDWWAKAIAFNQNNDCVEFHIHNLLWCVVLVIEAIENVGEITGSHQDEVQKKKVLVSKKYEKEWLDPLLFQLKYGKNYLVSQEMCSRLSKVLKEDQWVLSETVAGKGGSSFSKQENWLAELLVNPRGRMFPTSVLVGSNEYQVRRRLGSNGHYKEVQWMGESFVVRHLFGDLDPMKQEMPLLQSFSHPNVMNVMYAFSDEEKKECYLMMELMNNDLASYVKEICSSRRRIPFTLLVAVDIMLQIARGMEYLHTKNVYHGDLNPCTILVKNQNSSPDSFVHVKVAGIRMSGMKNTTTNINNLKDNGSSCIWHAPEVLSEQNGSGDCSLKSSEKADVYSFAMICFELLTGKVPFEDSHLQGDKMIKNIKAGERPLFPFPSPKYLTSLTKRCWHADPLLRPSFSSICRVLRYIKKFLVLNPDHSQQDPPMPPVDYFDIELSLCKRSTWATKVNFQVSAVPFQMFAYRIIEREKIGTNLNDKILEEETSICSDENAYSVPSEDSMSVTVSSSKLSSQDASKKGPAKKLHSKTSKHSGTKQNAKAVRPQLTSCGHSLQMNTESNLQGRRRTSAPVSDTELA